MSAPPAATTPLLTTYDVGPAVREMLVTNREHGHVHVMAAFRSGIGGHPRQQLGVLWRIDPKAGLLLVQSREPPTSPGKLGEQREAVRLACPHAGDVIDISVERSCQKTPPSQTPKSLRVELETRGPDSKKLGKAYRSRAVVVPEAERSAWAMGRLAAIGLAPDLESLAIGPLHYAALGARRKGIPFVEIRTRARVTDSSKFATAITDGVGKGKNYGLGLIRYRRAAEAS